MQEALMEIHGTNATDALALALLGMDDTLKDGVSDFFLAEWEEFVRDKYNIELQAADAIQTSYVDGTKGTACQ